MPKNSNKKVVQETKTLPVSQVQQNKSRSNSFAIFAGLLVVVAGFFLYNFFTNSKDNSGQITEEAAMLEDTNGVEKKSILERLFGKSEEENIEEEAVTQEVNGAQITETGGAYEQGDYYANWTANDLKQGDISGTTYTVQEGDTLWEIAEARYGNGSDWHKIDGANTVSRLANGNPLIVPGQVLVLLD